MVSVPGSAPGPSNKNSTFVSVFGIERRAGQRREDLEKATGGKG